MDDMIDMKDIIKDNMRFKENEKDKEKYKYSDNCLSFNKLKEKKLDEEKTIILKKILAKWDKSESEMSNKYNIKSNKLKGNKRNIKSPNSLISGSSNFNTNSNEKRGGDDSFFINIINADKEFDKFDNDIVTPINSSIISEESKKIRKNTGRENISLKRYSTKNKFSREKEYIFREKESANKIREREKRFNLDISNHQYKHSNLFSYVSKIDHPKKVISTIREYNEDFNTIDNNQNNDNELETQDIEDIHSKSPNKSNVEQKKKLNYYEENENINFKSIFNSSIN
jgi:hypothetical protein